jgi:hypothetical protein
MGSAYFCVGQIQYGSSPDIYHRSPHLCGGMMVQLVDA